MPKKRASSPDAFDALLGARVQMLRLQRGLSQDAVGTALGFSGQQLQKYERGESRLRAETLVRLAKLYAVSIESLFAGLDDDLALHGDEAKHVFRDPQVMKLALAYAEIDSPETRKSVLNLVSRVRKGNAD